ncbi:hypothetical protein [Acanthopleuribacter pedis]|uniref:Uncharacterized protein n=1 Tax=Acanthopleuribacter pedis TaxID=442870 RepID=A0A8J7Q7E1_9BACT|nr:hypothetical protein [Acanthopleuribacter pedis]MBO1319696.1 hypothetical protein [Acanthopleuribacter pedis]
MFTYKQAHDPSFTFLRRILMPRPLVARMGGHPSYFCENDGPHPCRRFVDAWFATPFTALAVDSFFARVFSWYVPSTLSLLFLAWNFGGTGREYVAFASVFTRCDPPGLPALFLILVVFRFVLDVFFVARSYVGGSDAACSPRFCFSPYARL